MLKMPPSLPQSQVASSNSMEPKKIWTGALAARLASDEDYLSDGPVPPDKHPSGAVSVVRNLEIGAPVPKGTAMQLTFVPH